MSDSYKYRILLVRKTIWNLSLDIFIAIQNNKFLQHGNDYNIPIQTDRLILSHH